MAEQQQRDGFQEARRRHRPIHERLIRSQGMPFREQPIREAGQVQHLQLRQAEAERSREVVPTNPTSDVSARETPRFPLWR